MSLKTAPSNSYPIIEILHWPTDSFLKKSSTIRVIYAELVNGYNELNAISCSVLRTNSRM